MAYSEELVGRVRAVAKVRPTVTEKKMFGGVAFMLNGNMFCGVSQDVLMARVGADHYVAALAKPHVRVMDFTGQPMKGYVYVDPAGMASDEELQYWVELCAEYVLTLPPKYAGCTYTHITGSTKFLGTYTGENLGVWFMILVMPAGISRVVRRPSCGLPVRPHA